jgi:hypothetical protein
VRDLAMMERIRRLLLTVLGIGIVGTGTELLLIGHTEEALQIVPLALLALGLAGAASVLARPTGWTLQLFRVLMGLFIVGGVLGVILHYRGNAEFELEMRPSMAGFELIWNSLTGATPALAPGSMIPLGLIGLISTLGRGPALASAPEEEESHV